MDINDNNLDGLKIETKKKPDDSFDFGKDDASNTTEDMENKDDIREEIKKIESEIASLTNTISYGDDERLSYLQGKLDALRVRLLKED